MMGVVTNLLDLLVSLVCAVPATAFCLIFGFFIWDGLDLPVGVNSHAEWHSPPQLTSSPLLTDALLLLIFPLQHTFMLRGPVSTLFKLLVPEKYQRSVYALSAGLALGITMYCWQPLPQPVWTITNTPIATAIKSLSFLFFLGVAVSICTLDPLGLDIIGLKKPAMNLLGWKPGEISLVDTGLYGLMRHPAYTTMIAGMWIQPTMTVGQLLLCSVYTLYIVLAVHYSEEPALIRDIGPSYVEYMKRTPPFIPSITRSKTKNE